MCVCVQVVQEYERAVIFRLGRLRTGGAKGRLQKKMCGILHRGVTGGGQKKSPLIMVLMSGE